MWFLVRLMMLVLSVFFFKQKTAYEIYQCDWSSDGALPICLGARLAGLDMVLLTTKGRRSGVSRTLPLAAMRDEIGRASCRERV